MTFTLALVGASCEDGSYSPGDLAGSFRCSTAVTVGEDTTLWQLTLDTQPNIPDGWSWEGENEWRRLIVDASKFYSNDIPKGTIMKVPTICSEKARKDEKSQ